MTEVQQKIKENFDVKLPDMTTTSQQELEVNCYAPMSPYCSPDNVTLLQQTSGGGFDGMVPDVNNTFHHQPVIGCLVPVQSYPLPFSLCPVSPLPLGLPCLYSPNDSGLVNVEDVSSTSQSPSSLPISSGSPVYCDLPFGYGTPYSFVTGGSYHPPSPHPPESQGEENVETSKEDCTSTPNVTRSPTPVSAVEDMEEEDPNGNKDSNLGGFRADGYWHPYPEDINESHLDIVTGDTSPQTVNCLKETSKQQQHDVHNFMRPPLIPPLLPHVISPPPIEIRLSPRQRILSPRSKESPKEVLSPMYNKFHRVDLPEHFLGRPQLLPTHYKVDQICVEEVWKMHTELLFKNFPDKWILNALNIGNKYGSNWNYFKDLAKVRFYCKSCRDGWTSMYGVVIFHYKLDLIDPVGQILYDVPGQKCRNCKPQAFEVPLWYPEEAQKVITNLYYKIGADCYNLTTPQFIRSRRQGQPRTFHNELLCQGCCHGICKNGCNRDE